MSIDTSYDYHVAREYNSASCITLSVGMKVNPWVKDWLDFRLHESYKKHSRSIARDS